MVMALEGIRILDLSRMPPGLFCSMMLADMGASVIRVETPPEVAGNGPGVAPKTIGEKEKRDAAYDSLNRNKRSVGVNLKTAEGREVFYRLCKDADVVLEGFRPGVVERLCADYETVRRINPRIIYCSISGYGQDGPYRLLPGHDINYISFAGALQMFGERGGPPVVPMNLVGDYAGGSLQAVIGILVALWARHSTGKGQRVDISITDGVVALLSSLSRGYFSNGQLTKRGEARSSGTTADYTTYETKDGKYISLGCIEPVFWENLCRVVGREDFIPHQLAKGEKEEEMFAYFRQVFLTKTRDEWFELLWNKNIAVGKVLTLDEVFTDPQVVHRQMVVGIDHPTLGAVKQVGIPIKLSDTPGKIRSLSPTFGEHTWEVLQELGYSKEEIAALRKDGAIK